MKKNSNSVLSLLLHVTGWAMLTAIVCIMLALYLAPVFHLHQYRIVSPSMEPTVSEGSLVYVKEKAPGLMEEGTIIAFERNGIPVIHRVVNNLREQKLLITKGDANSINDPDPVDYRNVVGEVILVIPYLGTLSGFLSSAGGKIVFLEILAGAYLLLMLADRMEKKKEPKDS